MEKIVFVIASFFLAAAARTQELKYGSCDNCWKADSLGNHRAVVRFNGTGKVARVVIPWRRRDKDPQAKRIILEDAKTHQKITNVKAAGTRPVVVPKTGFGPERVLTTTTIGQLLRPITF